MTRVVIRVEGRNEALAYFSALRAKIVSDATWRGPLERFGGRIRRYAASISPVITGSYQASHREAVSGKSVSLSISLAARNTATGTLVTRYAGPVEERHHVYARTWVEMTRLAVTILEDVARRLR